MAKRATKIGGPKKRSPHKTKKRLAAKAVMLAKKPKKGSRRSKKR